MNTDHLHHPDDAAASDLQEQAALKPSPSTGRYHRGHTIIGFSDDMLALEQYCSACRKRFLISVMRQEYISWKRGVPIQNAMPKLEKDQRELLISNVCGLCFDKMFQP